MMTVKTKCNVLLYFLLLSINYSCGSVKVYSTPIHPKLHDIGTPIDQFLAENIAFQCINCISYKYLGIEDIQTLIKQYPNNSYRLHVSGFSEKFDSTYYFFGKGYLIGVSVKGDSGSIHNILSNSTLGITQDQIQQLFNKRPIQIGRVSISLQMKAAKRFMLYISDPELSHSLRVPID